MADHRSLFLWIGSSFATIIGMATLSDWGIIIGILAGLASLASSGVNIYSKLKNKNKNKDKE